MKHLSPDHRTSGPNVMSDRNEQLWMKQWRSAAVQLPLVRARELRELTEEQATRQAIALEPVQPIP
ncbi:MAG: hypothetical protein ABGZ53_34490, partial [Fuerstiella sp.]